MSFASSEVAGDERRIADAEDAREFGRFEPGVELHIERVQRDYERALGWGVD